MWSVRRQRCAILSRCYLRGDRGTCEPQDLKDLFVSRDSKKNETAKGFAHFEDLRHSRVSPSFFFFSETFPLHSKVPTDPYLQYENPHRVSTHVARKGVVFFLGRPGFGWGFGISVSSTVWEISRETLRSRFPLAESLFQNCQVG